MAISSTPKPPKPNKKPYRHHHHPHKKSHPSAPPTITPGDTGIWATCTKGHEGKATTDLLDLFAEYAERLYGIHDNLAPAAATAAFPPPTTTTGTTAGTTSSRSSNDIDVPAHDVEAKRKSEEAEAEEDDDIERAIASEIHALKATTSSSSPPSSFSHRHAPTATKPHHQQLIQPIRLTTPCLLFFRTAPPLDPVAFTTAICRATDAEGARRHARFVKRVTPVSLVGRATVAGVAETAAVVLVGAGMGVGGMGAGMVGGLGGGVGAGGISATNSSSGAAAGRRHDDGVTSAAAAADGEGRGAAAAAEGDGDTKSISKKKDEEDEDEEEEKVGGRAGGTFAIRPTIRNNHVLSRTSVIETVAALVGAGWKVDLTKPDKVVLVEVWQNVCGVSVVDGGEYDRLKRFNLAELGVGREAGGGEGGMGSSRVVGGGVIGGSGRGVEMRGGGGGGCEGKKRKWDGEDGEEERGGKVVRGC